MHTVVLAAELEVEAVLELAEGRVLAARDGDGGGLVPRGVGLDLILERVVIEVVFGKGLKSAIDLGNLENCNIRRLHSGTDSCSSCSPYFILVAKPEFFVGGAN